MVDDPKQGGEELHTHKEPPQSPIAAREEETLAFWQRENIFEKSLKKHAPKGPFVFYDGPPFATGLPHYGHLLQSALKDALPRYKTMRGYRVGRQWGWDCHGLPLENQIEQELGIKTKREIEELGVEKFNKAAQNAVLRYAEDWKRIIPRFGRWVDMEHDYRTMDASYTESVWWAFKSLYDKGLIYEGFKAMHLCPRCGTTLSNFEVAQGYKDIDDIAVTVKLRLVDEPDTSLLIWTTTAWSLPGNAAAAVKADATYVKVRVGEEFVIVSAEYFSKNSSGSLQTFSQNTQPAQTMLGKELVGKRYEPPFEYYKDELHKHKTHAWKVYAADFVTLEDGTGIVHIAPAFGQDDLGLAQKEKIPLIHHVTDEGKFVATVSDFSHLLVKPKGNPRETDEKVAAHLEAQGLLFKKEKIKHSYPHCWRCDTPLLNWAANSWFVNVQKIKNRLVSENATVAWVPEHVGKGRFNNGLQSAPDWAISRSRYWGAPIPVWRHTKTKEIKVVGSTEELLSMVRRSGNTYFVMRHGEAQSNINKKLDCMGDSSNHLTASGKEGVVASAQRLQNKKIDLIIHSPLLRARETAALVQKELGLSDANRMVDERLRETGFGSFNDKTHQDWHQFFGSLRKHFTHPPEGGESYYNIRTRMGEFLFDIERRYVGKNILIISHGNPLWLLQGVARGASSDQLIEEGEKLLDKAEVREMPFRLFPHNERYELDLHRPYIDDIPMGDAIHGEWKRVTDVFDCWFESGSMPFASHHYPFETSAFNPQRFFGLFPKGYPAHFIAESIDQTRGWFYSLIVLGVGLFGKTPYKTVVTNGLILAEDGRKMSKKLKNYPDPMEVVEKYGADALRYYLLSSAVIRGEDLRFSERGVDEVSKKLLMRLDNVRSFYELYSDGLGASSQYGLSTHVLDKWILSRLAQLVGDTTDGFERYEIDTAARPLAEFIDDLSTWYVRRSRDRFKGDGEDKVHALTTLREVLRLTAQVMAPVMPFFAEDLYQRMKGDADPQSVHLTEWPQAGEIDEALLLEMKQVRAAASAGLKLREQAGIKVRQPLSKLSTATVFATEWGKKIVAEEVNVRVVETSTEDALDTELTPELKEEGMVRELIRRVQEMRKKDGLKLSDRPRYTLSLAPEEALVAEKHKEEIMKTTGLESLEITNA